jgi:hypothetical protein
LNELSASEVISFTFYATLAYIRHFIFAGCYDNGPWYLVKNLAGHLDLAGFYFSKWERELKFKYNGFDLALTRAPPDRKLTLYQEAIKAHTFVKFKDLFVMKRAQF